MDFIVGLPRTEAGYDSIWVIVDRLTKVAHFILVKKTSFGAKLAELYGPALPRVPRSAIRRNYLSWLRWGRTGLPLPTVHGPCLG
jgi:hypothetical protein